MSRWLPLLYSLLPFPAALGIARWTDCAVAFPFLAAAFLYPLFIVLVKRNRYMAALKCSLLWTLSGTLTVVLFAAQYPWRADQLIIRGKEYRQEMMTWVDTGVGRESTPSEFIPQHLLHAAFFSAVTFLSAGFLGLVAGAFLLNYMNVYVATYLTSANAGLAGLFLSWHPWALVRVGAYLLLGVYLSGLALWMAKKTPHAPPFSWLCLGVGGLVLDIVLKVTLAHGWQRLLAGFMG